MITYYAGQSREIADLFTRAVHETAREHYLPAQLEAWAPRPVDYVRWRVRCELKRPFLYVTGDQVAGFLELDPDGHIDCHYVSPDCTRSGVGGALLRHVIQIATDFQLPRLYVEASHVARGLYLKHDFTVVRGNEVQRRGQILQNWIMERKLGADSV